MSDSSPLVIGVSRTNPRHWTPSLTISDLLDQISEYLPVEVICVQDVDADENITLKQIGYLAVTFVPQEDFTSKQTSSPKADKNLSERLTEPQKRRKWLGIF